MAKVRRSVRRTVAGACAGAAIGYYLGAKAGRERYDQLHSLVRRAGGAARSGSAAKKARALVDLALEEVRATVSRLPGPLRSRAAWPPEADPEPEE